MAALIAVLMGTLLLLPAAAQSNPTASRSFGDTTELAPGGQFTVSITASDYGSAGGVTETLPTGFTYVSSSLDDLQVIELSGNMVRFTLQGDTSFTYTVTAPDAPGPYTFSGTLRDDDRMDYDVGGDSHITVQAAAAETTPTPTPTSTPRTSPGSPTATRSLSPTTVEAGASVTVTITARNYGQAGGVTEILPTGFSYVSSSLDASQVNRTGQMVRFTLQGDTSFTYTVTAPATTGPYTFSGTLRDDDRMDHTLGGDSGVTVKAAPGGPSATRSLLTSVDHHGAQLAQKSPSPSPRETTARLVASPRPCQPGSSTPPAQASTPSTQVNRTGQMVRFTLQGDTSFTYTVTAPATTGPYTFSGTLRDDDRNDHTVGGPNASPSRLGRVTPGGRSIRRGWFPARMSPSPSPRATTARPVASPSGCPRASPTWTAPWRTARFWNLATTKSGSPYRGILPSPTPLPRPPT